MWSHSARELWLSRPASRASSQAPLDCGRRASGGSLYPFRAVHVPSHGFHQQNAVGQGGTRPARPRVPVCDTSPPRPLWRVCQAAVAALLQHARPAAFRREPSGLFWRVDYARIRHEWMMEIAVGAVLIWLFNTERCKRYREHRWIGGIMKWLCPEKRDCNRTPGKGKP